MNKNLLYLLHKNTKGEWGMWKEYYKNGTAVYWQASTKEQIDLINWYLTRTDIRRNKRQRSLDEYIRSVKKAAERNAPEPIHFNICR